MVRENRQNQERIESNSWNERALYDRDRNSPADLSRPIIGIFSSDKEVIYYGAQAMKYFCPFYFLLGIMHSLAGTIRGTGKTVPPMVVMLLALCLFRILWIQFVVPHFTSIDIIYVLYPVSWAVGMVLMLIYAWKGNWMPKNIRILIRLSDSILYIVNEWDFRILFLL